VQSSQVEKGQKCLFSCINNTAPNLRAVMVNPNRFYTYAYLREDKTPYYVGKGSGKRAYKKGPDEIRKPKDKNRIIILKKNLTEEEAFNHERYMIAVFGRKNNGTGILRNFTDGGQGSSGRVVTEEEILRQKLVGKMCVENKIGFHGCSEEYMKEVRRKGTKKSAENRAKEFVVKDLEGNIIKEKNVRKFCEEREINHANFLMMLYGKQTMAYGYVLPETKITCYELLSPSGKKYVITNFHKYNVFCEEHNLSAGSFVFMLRGKFSHKKWKLISIFYR
jgi:hypothetical protein